MFGAKDEREFLSRRPWDFCPNVSRMGACLRKKPLKCYETALREGTYLFEWVHIGPIVRNFTLTLLLTKVVRGDKALLYATIRDITELKRADQQITRMARYDNLTGLVNRLVFVETLERRIARAQRDETSFASCISTLTISTSMTRLVIPSGSIA